MAVGDRCAGAGYLGMADPQCAAAELPDAGSSQRDLQQSVLATGKLDALRKVDVGARVSGQLKTLHVNIGDKVKKDQLLGLSIRSRRKTRLKRWKRRSWSCAPSSIRRARRANWRK